MYSLILFMHNKSILTIAPKLFKSIIHPIQYDKIMISNHLLSPIALGGGYDNALIYFLLNEHYFSKFDSRINYVSSRFIYRW